MFEFKGQVVIITGGTGGIGRAISEAFLRSNATIIVNYLSDDEKAENFKRENVGYSSRIDLQRFDVSDYKLCG